jgi:hypothetical protein
VEVGNQRVCLVVPDGTRTCPLPSLGITPVRALIDEAASMIPTRRLALSLVVASGTNTLYALAFGTPEESWAARADISSQTHVTYFDHPVRRVLSIMPTKYQDIWTAAKGFYKLEPIVADGGEVIIYAPHITQISVMYPSISEIGYHNRDYFLGQWDKFRNKPWGDLDHSTFDLRVAPFDRVCRVIKPRGRVQHGTSARAASVGSNSPAITVSDQRVCSGVSSVV